MRSVLLWKHGLVRVKPKALIAPNSNTLGGTFEDSILCIWQIYSKILIEFDPVEFLFVSFYLLAFQAIDQRFQRMHPLLARLRCPER